MSSDDLEERSRDLERRIEAAGGKDGVIGSLLIGAERNQKIVKWLIFGFIFQVVVAITVGVLALVAQHNAHLVREQAYSACIQTNKNSARINGFLDLLILFSNQSDSLTKKEKQVRVDGYERLKIDLPNCEEKAGHV